MKTICNTCLEVEFNQIMEKMGINLFGNLFSFIGMTLVIILNQWINCIIFNNNIYIIFIW